MENTELDGAVYPQWLTADDLLIVRAGGLFKYNVLSEEETRLDLPYRNLSTSNEVALSQSHSTDGYHYLVVTEPVEQKAVILRSNATNHADVDYQEWLVLGTDIGALYNPIISPDNTMVAFLETDTAAEDTEESTTPPQLNIYSLINGSLLEQLPLPYIDPTTATLLQWVE